MDTSRQRKEEMIPLREPDRDSDDSALTKTPTRRILLKFILLLLVIVILVAIIFCGGLLTGYNLFSDSSQCATSTAVASSRTWNWGESVRTTGGDDVSVLYWLDTELKGLNIKDNLRLDICRLIGNTCI